VRIALVFGIVGLLFILGCAAENELGEKLDTKSLGEERVAAEVISDEIKTTSDGTKYIVDPKKIRGGGPSKGGIGFDQGIPALTHNNMKFVSVSEADEWIEDNELVLALIYNGVKKVYPLQILVWHEIANDNVGGKPLIVTYCPLCGSGIAYEPFIEVEGKKMSTRFGTSGKLYNSNMVMYDEETDTYWQQIDGKAIVGDLVGQELKEVSIDTVVWRDWKKEHPDSLVLSQDTGIDRDYGKDPYGSYYEDSFLIFPVDNTDSAIHPKTIIFGIEVEGEYKAYIEEDLIEVGVIHDKFDNIDVTVRRDSAGIVTVTNELTGKEIVKERDMWFAWYAFHPKTKVWGR
jgi:hypothetical protein